MFLQTTANKNGEEPPGPRPFGRTHRMWMSRRTWRPPSTRWRLSLAL